MRAKKFERTATDYEEELRDFLRAMGYDTSVRFVGSHYLVWLWDTQTEVWLSCADVVRTLDDIRGTW